jgi:hypothetical protein
LGQILIDRDKNILVGLIFWEGKENTSDTYNVVIILFPTLAASLLLRGHTT